MGHNFRAVYNKRLQSSSIAPKDEDLVCRRIWKGLGLNKGAFYNLYKHMFSTDIKIEEGLWRPTKQVLRGLCRSNQRILPGSFSLLTITNDNDVVDRVKAIPADGILPCLAVFFTRIKGTNVSLAYSVWSGSSSLVYADLEPPYTISRKFKHEGTCNTILCKQATEVFVESLNLKAKQSVDDE